MAGSASSRRSSGVDLRRFRALAAPAIAVALIRAQPAPAADNSAPAILQAFETTYASLETRLPDIFAAGFGVVQTPPPGRADQGRVALHRRCISAGVTLSTGVAICHLWPKGSAIIPVRSP